MEKLMNTDMLMEYLETFNEHETFYMKLFT